MNSRLALIAAVVLAIGIVLWLTGTPKSPPPALTAPSEPEASAASPADPIPVITPANPRLAPVANSAAAPPPQPQAIAPFPAAVNPAAAAPAMPPTAVGSVPPPSPPDAEVNPEQISQDLDKVSISLRDYRTLMAQNPVGTNSEITKALMGGNAKGAQLAPEGIRVNGSGEMVDRWGTAYFFHQISATSMEIHSAGPDKQMGTDDDIVLR